MTPLFTVLIISNFIQSATAWEPRLVNGQIVTWSKDSIGFEINTDNASGITPEQAKEAIIAAAKEWDGTEIGAQATFIYEGENKKQGANLGDGVHLISFDTSWNQDPSLLAVTHVWSNANNEIVHFDVEINADDIEWSTSGDPNRYDLHNAMTHEFGHALGLEHSDDTEASMASTTVMGEISKRDINVDDEQGILSLYPVQNNSTTDDSTSSTDSNSNTGTGGSTENALLDTPDGSTGQMGPVPLEQAGCSKVTIFDYSPFLLLATLLVPKRRDLF